MIRLAPSMTSLLIFWVWSGLPIWCGQACPRRCAIAAGRHPRDHDTGDYPPTARAIAQQAGIDVGDLMSGQDLAGLDDAALADRIGTATVYARIQPEQKMRIVQALKANGEIVAMTGDGVNDAPSLKAAHIGIAMGGRGTDVAREASAIVLIKDDFSSIVHAIRLGRRIYDNLRKAMGFVDEAHIPIAGLALLPLAFGIPLILFPVHIAFLEMVIDPVSSIAFEAEPEEGDVMSPPHAIQKARCFHFHSFCGACCRVRRCLSLRQPSS